MMLRLIVWCGWLLLSSTLLANTSLKLDSLTVGSKTYHNVTVLGANSTDLYFTHDQGISNVKLRNLSPEVQQQFNYDVKAATEAEQKQIEEDTRYQNYLAAKLAAKAEKLARDARNAAATSEESLADPVSDKALLGKAAPPLEVEKWLGDKPEMEGKYVLITFWAPWSIPCRKVIPDLNALQKKFAEKLVVVGLSSEAEADVAALTEPKLEFASAVDTKARLSTLAGVTSIPYVLLLDRKGIVRYQGHPGVITEKLLQPLLAKPAE